ncbi:hypothetical protein BHM03_00006945 [Ensete ventricosum]|nr:hypothetical protein BHM03_00006945 [Ensete ventricosum]
MGGRSSKSRGSNHYPQYVSTTSRGTSRYSSHPGAHDQPIATGRLQKKYSNIGDDYNSVEQVRIALWSSPCEVTHSVGTDHGQLSPQERDTINAIVKASNRRGIEERIGLPPPVNGNGSTAKRSESSITYPNLYISDLWHMWVPNEESSFRVWASGTDLFLLLVSAISVTCTNNVLRKQTCYDCGKDLNVCPICSSPIAKKIKLY